MSARFRPGHIVATPGFMAAVQADETDARQFITRHLSGDWGDVCEEDRAANDAALKDGDRLLSSYETNGGTKFWIITEADRSATTLLLPSEY